MDYQKKAMENFENGYNCSQAVVAAFSKELNIDEETFLKYYHHHLVVEWPGLERFVVRFQQCL